MDHQRRARRTAVQILLLGMLLGFCFGAAAGFRGAQEIYERRIAETVELYSATSPSVDREAARIIQQAQARAEAIREGRGR